ncbi:MAG: thioredoxin family protein [Chitinophagales bacterium]|nr:thioredoxin family protein [Chitinophagales bacterium]
MKRYFLIIAVFLHLIINPLIAQEGIEFFHGSFDEAKALAKEQGKLIFMDAYAVWCGPCKQMTNNVFPQKEVGDFFNKNFINMKVDMEKGEGLSLRSTYGVSAYPTLLFIDAQGNVVESVRGARSAESLLSWAKSIALPEPGVMGEMRAQYENGDRSIDFLKEYIKAEAAHDNDYDAYFAVLLDSMTNEEKMTSENASFILEHTSSMNSPSLAFIASNKSFFKNLNGEAAYDKVFNAIASKEGKLAAKTKDLTKAYDVIDFLKKYKPSGYKKFSSELMINYFAAIKDWNSYDKAVSSHLSKYNKVDDGSYKEVAWVYYMNMEEEDKLKKAEKWMQEAIKQNNTYENNLTQAYLLYKLQEFSAAEDAVNYALILADGQKRTDNAQILKDQILKKLNKVEIAE